MTLVASIAIAYLIGSISFAVLVSRAFGLPDPRTNVGTDEGRVPYVRYQQDL